MLKILRRWAKQGILDHCRRIQVPYAGSLTLKLISVALEGNAQARPSDE